MRTQAVGELAENAVDLLSFLRLELANSVSELHRGWRLDEERRARCRRAVHDAADAASALAANGNHVSSVANRHRDV